MKKTLVSASLLFSLIAYTQNTFPENGNVGIGNTTPNHKLEVVGSSGIRLSNSTAPAGSWMTIMPHIDVAPLNPGITVSAAQITSRNYGHLVVDINANDGNDSFAVRTDSNFDGTVDLIPFVVKANGKIGMGTTNPDAKLTVKGNIHTEEVRVDLAVPAPDYVFKDNYNLVPLNLLQNYIKANGHLPNIPSAREMEKNGITLGIMNMKLLEKIEELTLYTLQQEAKLKKQQEINTNLQNRLTKLEQYIQNNN